jgi:DNA-directed RNA polymerase subunit RPC12/RpoP
VTYEEQPDPISLQGAIKELRCPRCGGQARLLVDLDSGFPAYDDRGHRQYFCLQCDQRFSVDRLGHPVR